MQKFTSSFEHVVHSGMLQTPIGNDAIQRKSFKTVNISEYKTDVFMFMYDLT